MSEPSPLSLRALYLAKLAIVEGVRGGVPPWARFRGPVVDGYQRAVGLAVPPNPTMPGHPWCIAAVYAQHVQAAQDEGQPHFCPRTASTVHAIAAAPSWCELDAPRPGATFIFVRPDGTHGHAGMVDEQNPDATWKTAEGDTAGPSSSYGDLYGSHDRDFDNPQRYGFASVRFFDFGLPPPA